jgi:Na+-translocating ferredoxin:NAD+ oxidoreductase RnfD subunit
MRAYPLIRRRWSNEHIMAALFAVIIFYLVPQWLENPVEFPAFLAVLVLSLLMDGIAGFIKYKRLVCSVSAAVTAGIFQVITPGIPFWGRLIGIAAAIIMGKQLWGGTGKNTLNPAIVGYWVVCIIFGPKIAPIEPSMALIPALLLSLPFILFRPFASIGLIGGMALAMLTGGSFADMTVLVNSIFFGCLVITDPVTVTPLKTAGLIL